MNKSHVEKNINTSEISISSNHTSQKNIRNIYVTENADWYKGWVNMTN